MAFTGLFTAHQSTLLCIPQPHRGNIVLLEMESLQPCDQMSLLDAVNAGCPDISCRWLSGMDQACKKIVIAKEDIWCDVDENLTKCRRQGWQALLYFYICRYPIQVCIMNLYTFVINCITGSLLKHIAAFCIHFCRKNSTSPPTQMTKQVIWMDKWPILSQKKHKQLFPVPIQWQATGP